MINRPQPDEYAPFYSTYIKLIDEGTDILALLEELKGSTYNLFSSMSAERAAYAYAEGKWTIKQLLGHMIDAERVFAYRALCFSRGEKELPGFDENTYVANANFNDRDIKDLANEFKTVREANLYLFRSLTTEQLLRTGIANGSPVSVRALIFLTAGHELHSLRILRERY